MCDNLKNHFHPAPSHIFLLGVTTKIIKIYDTKYVVAVSDLPTSSLTFFCYRRSEYSGPLTYATQWSGPSAAGTNYIGTGSACPSAGGVLRAALDTANLRYAASVPP